MFDLATAPPRRVMARTENHLYLRPHPALAGHVAHYTITFPAYGPPPAEGDTGLLWLMPDIGGCFVFEASGQDWIWGAQIRAVAVEKDFDAGPMRFFVEWKPGGASHLLGLEMPALKEQRLVLGDVLPSLRGRIKEAVETTADIGRLLEQVDGLLLGAVVTNTGLAPDVIAAILRLLPELPAKAPVRALADRTGYSERHLGRLFNQSFGLGVKATTRVIRVNRMLDMLQPTAPLAVVAQQAGYYDQAHLDHDMKAICGVSPTEYLRSLADFYKEEYKF